MTTDEIVAMSQYLEEAKNMPSEVEGKIKGKIEGFLGLKGQIYEDLLIVHERL